ncbi:MAG: hypothetical protein LUF33_06400 [Clostridiales bacterium]|nr:hypothetical protein [Clostridiales bacterium]
MKKTPIVLLLTAVIFILSACSSGDTAIDNINEPNKDSTSDQIYPAQNDDALEESGNVNGMRFALTLEEFTDEYNEIIEKIGGEYLETDKWTVTGEPDSDTNGVELEYYYYDCEKYNFTATVEAESEKLVNVGCGTAMSVFVSQNEDENYSDVILERCAAMAAAACGFPSSSIEALQDIFYRTTFEDAQSLWYQGCIYSLSTDEDSKNSDNSTMLFRVFPVTEEKKQDWNIMDYETYIASASADSNSVTSG